MWKKLWKWKGPSRTKHFLWLVMHDRLLTNKERVRRKMTADGNCSHCKDVEETTEHILRKCSKTAAIWEKFRIEAWFSIYKMALQNVERSFKPPVERRQEEVGWRPPPEGWVQVQTDGSVLSPSGYAAAGGLLRDSLGRCSSAFACNMGKCSITAAELKGAIVGLQLAWERGFRKVQLKLDSTTAIAIIRDRSDDDHRHGILAKHVNHLLDRDWDVSISHVYREGNRTADFLANLGHSLTFGTHHVDVCCSDLCRWLDYDVMGISQTRIINT
ncbi:unnamed protein product [Linum tenue]|uniref:RNase H type-1 domain-containing protein n=1 Tax=Linum tenue TaxID=586396 RepID=A0AAV0L690_9ROSI|nr:unnamed protein product [Linum tenue]